MYRNRVKIWCQLPSRGCPTLNMLTERPQHVEGYCNYLVKRFGQFTHTIKSVRRMVCFNCKVGQAQTENEIESRRARFDEQRRENFTVYWTGRSLGPRRTECLQPPRRTRSSVSAWPLYFPCACPTHNQPRTTNRPAAAS